MSFLILNAVWKASLPPMAKLVLVALADFANESGECFPSVGMMVERCGMSDRGIQKQISELERSGYLRREFRNGRSTLYTITPEHGSPHPRTTFTPAPNDVHPEHGSPSPPNGVHPTPEHGSPTPEPRSPITATQPSPNRHLNRQSARDAERFDEFWKAYPRKTGSIPQARKTWAKQKLDQQADSIIAIVIDRAANDPQWSDPRFIPYPTTFLNQQRWNDEWTPAKKKPSAADRFTGKTYEGSSDDELPAWAH